MSSQTARAVDTVRASFLSRARASSFLALARTLFCRGSHYTPKTTAFYHHYRATHTLSHNLPRVLRPAGAEFWSTVFFTSTLAIPVLLQRSEVIPVASMLLSIGGVITAVFSVFFAAYLQARSEDSFGSW